MRNTRGKDLGSIIVFVTTGTQEESWFESMTENMTDVTFRYCPSVEHFLNIFKEN
jgi:hypothetical protein